VGERFFQEFTLRQVLLNAAKNGCGPSAAGTSSRAEGPNTATPAESTASPVPEATVEQTGASVPIASTP
jgi:purine nucleoside phosphorylase